MKTVLLFFTTFLFSKFSFADLPNQAYVDADMVAVGATLSPYGLQVACADIANSNLPFPTNTASIAYNVKLSDGSIKYYEIENGTLGSKIVARIIHGPLDTSGVSMTCK